METIRPILVTVTLLLFLTAELIIPYRRPGVSKLKRWFTNISFTVFNTLILTVVFSQMITATTVYHSENNLGLLNRLELPFWANVILTIVFMDFMLYVWHLLNHEMPLLWRFHRVHHSDMNMDVSTATRFHIGELAISAVIKVGLISFLGANIISLVIFETLLNLTSQFHHSSIRAPHWFEKIYWIAFVPPSMHRIHHSVVIKERDRNYGTIFSIWDRIFGTHLKNVDQTRIKIGLGSHQKPDELGFFGILTMPFKKATR